MGILYYNGHRPGFDYLAVPFPPKLKLLVEACWAAQQADRPRFSDLAAVLSSGAAALLELEAEEEVLSYDAWLASLQLTDAWLTEHKLKTNCPNIKPYKVTIVTPSLEICCVK